jgi:MSHA biogenesis protein MshJ
MKMPAAIDAMVSRFDRMTLRERVLIFIAVLAVALVFWQSAFMEKLTQREKTLSLELQELQENVSRTSRATEAVSNADPTTVALRRLEERQKALDAIDKKLAAESAGLIPPAQMVQVVHDVLKHQHGLTLVSLRNLPVAPLVSAANEAGVSESGPYLHPVELVIEGRYLDIVAYLHALEGLPWRFYWRVLELETKTYPLNRVRIELSTLSLDKEWIGV